ncbi:hypothetical protein DENSPDRAFT_802382 [Dentipellis sp. KUC8613]|nr:hypothetical protein DENSPDRAFT_802382 [Dentipellis sp. KUC8613]
MMFATLAAAATALVSAALVGAQEPPNPHNVYVKPGLNASLCLDNASPTNGARITVEICDWNKPSQFWNFDNGGVRPVNSGSRQCLDVKDGKNYNGNTVQLWECVQGNTNQQWYYTGDNRWAGILIFLARAALAWTDHGKCLDLTNGNQTPGTVVQIWECTDNDQYQIWNFDAGTVRPVNANGVQCLDVKDGNNADGTLVQLYQCYEGNTNQQWYYTGDNRLAWTNHGKCLDLTDGNQTPGTIIKIWTCTDNDDNQVWNTVDAASAK